MSLHLTTSLALFLCCSQALTAELRAPTSDLRPPRSDAPTLKAASVTSMEALDDQHELAIGDQLSFRVLEDQEEAKPIIVADSGEIELPLLGRYPAIDKTPKQLAHELKTELEKKYYYQATVILAVDVMTKSRGKVYLVGKVHVAGPQDIPSDEVLTLGKAILRAGRFSDFADKKKVTITRQTAGDPAITKTIVVNVVEIFEQGKTEKDVPLLPGDMIFVPSRLINL